MANAVPSVAATTAIISSVVSHSGSATPTTKTFIESEVTGVPLASAANTYVITSGGASASATQQYKTVYITKTAAADSNTSSSSLEPGAIAGIVVGVLAGLALIIGLVYFLFRRRRSRRNASMGAHELPSTSGSQVTMVAEKDGGHVSELSGKQAVYEVSSGVFYEMEASVPELDGKPGSLSSTSRHIMSRGRPVKRDTD